MPIRLCYAMLLCLCFCLFPIFSTPVQATSSKNVLLLHSYHHGNPWTDAQDKGIHAALTGQEGLSINVFTVYLDAQRMPLPSTGIPPQELLPYRIRQMPFDLLICTDNDAFSFLLNWSEHLFPNVPVVFCGVNNFQPAQLAGHPNFTGLAETLNFEDTFALAVRQQPQANTALVLVNTDITGKYNKKMFETTVIPLYQNRIHFQVIDGPSIDEALSAVKTLSKNDVVMLMATFTGTDGRPMDIKKSTQMLTQASPCPVYTNWDFFLPHGVIGGKITKGELQGKTAGELALKLLQGVPLQALPVIEKSPTVYMLDYTTLTRFNLPIPKSTPDTEIINQPKSIFSEYRNTVISGLVIFLVLSVLVVLLLYLLRQNRQQYFQLSHTYEATLQGWAKALDLRDKETENHTQRVTRVTLRLAKLLHFPAEQLLSLRQGAMLHDIGKLGIPDNILLKPAPLTEAEWVIMKKHPVYAYEWLQPIPYLRPALAIPYCHHERWDGTGYPRGLKGEEIPLSARIFSVVDVWDALSSDRPYRKAWPKGKVFDYLKEHSGTHFDPQIVSLFLQHAPTKAFESLLSETSFPVEDIHQ